MALLRRYSLYALIAVGLIYLLHSLNVPYQEDTQRPYVTRPQPDGSQRHDSVDWAKWPLKYPVATPIPLPKSEPAQLPHVQFDFASQPEDAAAKTIREARRDEVRKQFLKCWRNYRARAWMHDEIKPISGEVADHFGGWAATLIDALDTLWIMGFSDEFNSAIDDIASIDFGYTPLEQINVFETNIRHLGGLLAAFDLSRDKRLLAKAVEVGNMLYHAFDTPNHMPITRWRTREAAQGKPQVADEQVLLAEIGSLSMEFTRLSQLTGNVKYYDAVTRITRLMEDQQDKTKLPGMWPLIVNAKVADFTGDNTFTLNAMADSMYEYLPKMYALLGGQDASYRKMYEKAMDVAAKHALFRPSTPEDSDLLASGVVRVEGSSVMLEPVLQHLSCYTGGMYALGSRLFAKEEHYKIARKLTDTCVWAYKSTKSGIMPEVSHLMQCPNTTECHWNEKEWHDAVAARADHGTEKDPLKNIANLRLPTGFTAIDDRRYILRPEAIESVFVMYRVTGEQAWQAAAWDMWTAIQRNTDTDLANSALSDVSVETPPREDSMESFWMAETLKYFFLVFSEPNVISLDDFVLNTEAHPFRIPKPSNRSAR
ncbi:hypothetical protein ACEQ8H_001008 [Pleosporales sp. CAS-2024a]